MEESRETWRSDLYELRLVFHSRQRRQVRLVALLHAVDVWRQVELLDVCAARRPPASGEAAGQEMGCDAAKYGQSSGSDYSGLRLITRRGETLTGYPLFERLVRSLRLLWPLALVTWIPGITYLGRARYPGVTVRSLAPSAPSTSTPAAKVTSSYLPSRKGVRS